MTILHTLVSRGYFPKELPPSFFTEQYATYARTKDGRQHIEKSAYLTALSDTRAVDYDLTPFLKFALKGVESQCRRLLAEIREHIAKALFRNTVTDLFGRLKSPRKRVMSARHVQILNLLLEEEEMTLAEIEHRTAHLYALKNPLKALVRDLTYLLGLQTMSVHRPDDRVVVLRINLQWPTQITETEFFRLVKALPKGKLHGFLSS